MTTSAIHTPSSQYDGTRLTSAAPTDANAARAAGVVAIIFTGAIFGFFFAWVCSTMWGLDDSDPRIAIEAMQAMNESVRNPVFFPAFFGTPVALMMAAGTSWNARARRAAKWFLAAAIVYFVGGFMLTAAFNVPMNEDLADVVVPQSIESAEAIWNDYSGTWQRWNVTRTFASGISLVFASIGLMSLAARRPSQWQPSSDGR